MKLNYNQVMSRWQAYVLHANRVQELKDLLLELKTVGTAEELDENENSLREIREEIRTIYQDCMLPILREILDHVEEYHDKIAQALSEDYEDDVMGRMDQFLDQAENALFGMSHNR